jgi:hypothetical protein
VAEPQLLASLPVKENQYMKSSNVPEGPRQTWTPEQSRNAKMEAIAYGVQARLEERTGYSRRITNETVDIARALGVADREIEKWVNQRSMQLACNEERLKSIKTRLEKMATKARLELTS